MTGQPLVSVIIPAYNAEKYIGETLQSVLGQRFRSLEVIVVNDGSKDGTEQVVKTFSDARIRFLAQPNQGCSAAKNTGLHASTGDFIQYLDADDLLSPGKIEEQVDALNGKPYGIAISRTVVFADDPADPANPEIDTRFLYSTSDTLGFVLNLYGAHGDNGMIQPNAFLLPRPLAQKIGDWDLSISPSPDEDGEYFCRAMLGASDICFTPGSINYYRKPAGQETSLSRQLSPAHACGGLRSLTRIADHLLLKEDSQRVKEVIARRFAAFIYQFSSYRDLVREATTEIHRLGIKKIPAEGGKTFKLLAKFIGFRNAMRMRDFVQK
jgi:glycosyltransferase involved in cell wall biosynthesis